METEGSWVMNETKQETGAPILVAGLTPPAAGTPS